MRTSYKLASLHDSKFPSDIFAQFSLAASNVRSGEFTCLKQKPGGKENVAVGGHDAVEKKQAFQQFSACMQRNDNDSISLNNYFNNSVHVCKEMIMTPFL